MNELYDLAYAYKRTRLWEKLWDQNIFAVKLANGETGYVSIMGQNNRYNALAVFVGDEGFMGFYKMFNSLEECPLYENMDIITSQKNIQCVFDDADELTEEEYEAVGRYASQHHISFDEPNAYAHFLKYEPGLVPWPFLDEQDQDIIKTGLKAAIAFADDYQSFDLLREYTGKPITIACYETTADGYQWTTIKTPEYYEESYIIPIFNPEMGRDEAVEALRQGSNDIVLQCGLLTYSVPVQDEETIPYFPDLFIAAEEEVGYGFCAQLINDVTPKRLGECLNILASQLIDHDCMPTLIKVPNPKTQAMMEDFAKAIDATLIIDDNLDVLEEFYTELSRQSDDDSYDMYADDREFLDKMRDIMEELIRWDQDRLDLMPPRFYELLQLFDPQTGNPALARDYIDEFYDMVFTPTSKSYVISVRKTPRHYYHVQMPGTSTLTDLSNIIVDLFNLEENHLYVFRMRYEQYYEDNFAKEWDYLSTSDVTLDELDLFKEDIFKYTYDFGESHVFTCKLLREEEPIDTPQIIKKVGR